MTSALKILRSVIMGPPGSGKGTIANRIVKDFGLYHLATGDILRSNIAQNSVVGLKAKLFLEAGDLVPDEIMMQLVLSELEKNSQRPWLLDGFPRTTVQCDGLMSKHSLNVVINLDVPFDEIISRVKDRYIHPGSGRIYNLLYSPPKQPGVDDVTGEPLVQREDDKPDTVKERLETYQRKTAPVLDFFQQRGILVNFPTRSSNEVWPKVHAELSKFCKPIQFTKYE